MNFFGKSEQLGIIQVGRLKDGGRELVLSFDSVIPL